MENKSNNYMIPIAVVIAGAMVAGAVMFSPEASGGNIVVEKNNNKEVDVKTAVSLDNLRPVDGKDHIVGNPNAAVKIVEYSDFECPFCKRFHFTMKKVMEEYGKNGDVAWVFRQFPLDQLHPKNARRVAVASECAADQKGNDGFWGFTDKFFELTPSNDRTNIDVIIPQIANEIDLDMPVFNECLSSGKYDEHIQDDISNAIATGGRGTPWSIIIAPNGKEFPVNGAQPLQAVKSLIDLALEDK